MPETRRAARRVRQSRPSSRRDAFGRDELRPSPGLSRQPQARREAEEDTLSALAHHLPFKNYTSVTSLSASQDLHSRNFPVHLSIDAAINEVDSPPCEARAAGDTPPSHTHQKASGTPLSRFLLFSREQRDIYAESKGFSRRERKGSCRAVDLPQVPDEVGEELLEAVRLVEGAQRQQRLRSLQRPEHS